jgi:hypothetical protein
VINGHECITECPRWAFCSTPVYTGRCSKVCFELKGKYESTYRETNHAYWEHRASYNDYLWVECSNCKFQVEKDKAVICDGSDTKFSEAKYRFCPICGKEMRVH